MKKIGVLILIALMAFACNTKNKTADENTSQEVKIENLVEVTIPVHGMTCTGCENAIKKSVESLEGIAAVTASFVDSIAVVKFDNTATSIEAIEGKITEAGYTVARNQ